MKIEGKKALFLGDSITEGVGASCIENCYVNVFERLTGCKTVNYGISGTRYAVKKADAATPGADRNYISRVDEMCADADIVVVFGGTNDFGHGDAPLGGFSDRDPNTFYGACHILYRKLLEKYPDAVIVVMTPMHRLSENVTTNEIGLPCERLIEFVKAEREVAEYYSLPVLDLFASSGIQPAVDVIREKYMPDGLHPSDAGARIIAERLKGLLETL